MRCEGCKKELKGTHDENGSFYKFILWSPLSGMVTELFSCTLCRLGVDERVKGLLVNFKYNCQCIGVGNPHADYERAMGVIGKRA